MSSEIQVKPKLVAVAAPSKTRAPQPVFARASIYFNNIGYCSLSEAVCGTLLELFVPDFKIREAETFQIPLGNGSSVDFFVNDVLIEFHGVRFQAERGRYGDFNNKQEYVHYNRRLRQLRGNRYKRQQLMELTRERLMQNYFQRRRRLIDQHSDLRECELVVASNCDEFFDRVIRRFNRTFCPNRTEFRQIFYALVKVVARQNSVSKHQFGRERARA